MAEGLSNTNLKPTSLFAHMCTCSHKCNMRHWSPGHSAVPSISQAALGVVHLSSDCSSLPSNKFVPKCGSVVSFLTPLLRRNVLLTTFPGHSLLTSSPQIFSRHTRLMCGFSQSCFHQRSPGLPKERFPGVFYLFENSYNKKSGIIPCFLPCSRLGKGSSPLQIQTLSLTTGNLTKVQFLTVDKSFP